jgi:hypothetical protein
LVYKFGLQHWQTHDGRASFFTPPSPFAYPVNENKNKNKDIKNISSHSDRKYCIGICTSSSSTSDADFHSGNPPNSSNMSIAGKPKREARAGTRGPHGEDVVGMQPFSQQGGSLHQHDGDKDPLAEEIEELVRKARVEAAAAAEGLGRQASPVLGAETGGEKEGI